MTRTVNFKGALLHLKGETTTVGSAIPSFTLVNPDMSEMTESALKGKRTIVITVPSIDTPTCAIETKRFNQEATSLGSDIEVLVVSRDLPFAQKRFCGAEGIERVKVASDYKYRSFESAFGTTIEEWALLARAVFVVDASGKITYAEYVAEVSAEPNYEAALAAVKAA